MRVVVAICVMLCGGEAFAGPLLQLIEPTPQPPVNGAQTLQFGALNQGTTSAPMRIRVRNIGDQNLPNPEVLLPSVWFTNTATGGSLAVGQDRYWDFVASPSVTDKGPLGEPFEIRYSDGDNPRFITVNLRATARGVPWDAPTRVEFQLPPPNTAIDKTITIMNTSSAPQEVLDLATSITGFSARLRTGTLPLTVAAGATFDVDVTVNGPAPDTLYEGTLGLVLAGGTVHASNLAARTTGLIEMEALSFAGVPDGASWQRPGVLRSYSSTAITITGTTINDSHFAVVGIGAGTVIPPYGRVPFSIVFAPTAATSYTADLDITFDAATPVHRTLSGRGEPSWNAVVTQDGLTTDGLLEFGTLDLGGAPVTRMITIQNPSIAVVGVTTCDIGQGDGFSSTSTCPATIAANGSFDVSITFDPSTAGEHTRSFAMRSSALSQILDVPYTARVVLPFAFSATELDFGDTIRTPLSPHHLEVTVTNTGSAAYVPPAATVEGPGFTLLSSPTASIAPGATAKYSIGFLPDDTRRYFGGLVIGPTAAPVLRVPLEGRGVERMVAADTAIDFGSVTVGMQETRPATIHNASVQAVTLTSAIASDPRFTVVLPASAVIAPNADLIVQVVYEPSTVSVDTAQLALAFDGDAAELSIELRGTGLEVGMPDPDPDPDDGGGCCRASNSGGSWLLGVALLGWITRRRRRATA